MGNEAYVAATQASGLPPSLIGAREVETQRWVLRNEGAQLATGVAGGAEHPDRKFMHEE